MDQKQKVALAGIGLFFIGMFMPMVQVLVLQVTLMQGDGKYLVLPLILTALCVIKRHFKTHLLISVCLCMYMISVMLGVKDSMSALVPKASEGLAGALSSHLANASVSMSYGIAVIMIGLALMIVPMFLIKEPKERTFY